MKQLLINIVTIISMLMLSQANGAEIQRCSEEQKVYENCWSRIESPDGGRYVGLLLLGKPYGEGIDYFSNGLVRKSGIWRDGELVQFISLDKSKFPFDDSLEGQAARDKETELVSKFLESERNRPPSQKIAFCVQTVRVETRGTTFPSISVPYCQDACNKTYTDMMCSEVGGNKWRVQASSPKTSPPNSQYFSGMGTCSCVGQEYVLNEIKETPPPAPAPVAQNDLREAELAKREKALAEREKALLEAENKRLRDELEASKKKKK